MDHLNQANARQRAPQFGVTAKCVGSAAALLRDNCINVIKAGEQKRRNRRRHRCRDFGNQRLIDHAWAARHVRHQAKRVHALGNRKFCFTNTADAANLKFHHARALQNLLRLQQHGTERDHRCRHNPPAAKWLSHQSRSNHRRDDHADFAQCRNISDGGPAHAPKNQRVA